MGQIVIENGKINCQIPLRCESDDRSTNNQFHGKGESHILSFASFHNREMILILFKYAI